MQTAHTGAGRRPRHLPRLTRARIAAIAVGVAATATAGGVVVANAAVPAFPDNVVVFPDRDFVTIEGYQDHIGEQATVTVTRSGTVMGSAVGTVAEGDVAFEINHPGGYCWGAGGGPAVTPDIRKGDKVSIRFADGTNGDTTVSTGTATKHALLDSNTNTVTVTGTYGGDVTPAQAEVRIVNPDLTPLVGKRDVRAVPGPPTPAPRGGYTSDLDMKTDGTFTATFVFDTLDAAKAAAAPQIERFMSWQVEDADANRQGLTISEYGEAGGPGMGGCPAGPGDVAPPQASYTATRSTSDTSKLAVKWTPADPIPGAAAITGYSVEAVKADGTLVGARTGPSATGVTLTVDPAVAAANYSIEVRTMTGAKMGEPFTLAPTTGSGDLPADQTIPKLTANPAAGEEATPTEATSVSLASESAADVYYTTDGSFALTGDLPSDSAKLYTGTPIPIKALTQLRAVAIDRAGNLSDRVIGFYAPPATELPAAPASPVLAQPTGADVSKTSVKLSWAKVDKATSYLVTAYSDAGVALPAAQQPGETSNLSQTIAGLNGSTPYRFTVTAINAAGQSQASNEIRVVTLENLTIGTAKWKTGDFRVTGSSSALNGTVTVWRATADGTPTTQIGTLSAALTSAAPAAGSTYDWRLRTGVPTTNPGRIVVKSTSGAVSAVFTATNG
jgi:hypothetical protein